MHGSTPVIFAIVGQSTSLFPLISMFAVFVILYFLIIRPQARRQKEREGMLKRVKKGDRIVTTSGIYGTVVSTPADDRLVVKIAENVRVEMARPAVAAIVSSGTEEPSTG